MRFGVAVEDGEFVGEGELGEQPEDALGAGLLEPGGVSGGFKDGGDGGWGGGTSRGLFGGCLRVAPWRWVRWVRRPW